jgi:hypothetical protein
MSKGDTNGKGLNLQPSVNQQVLCRELMKLNVGETRSYLALSSLIKADVQRDKRYILQSALRAMLREERMVFGVITGVGIYRMNDAQIVDVSAASVGKFHRLSARAIRKLACADFEHLDNDHKIKHHTAASILGTLAYATRTTTVRKIES